MCGDKMSPVSKLCVVSSAAVAGAAASMIYDAADPDHLKLVHEYVVPLPVFKDAKDKTTIAAESEIVVLSDKAFLMLARDSGNGQGLKGDTSLYRKVDIVDVSAATDIAGSDFDAGKPIAPKGIIDPSLTPATLTPFIDLNDKADLIRFGLHNGAPNDRNNLSEKWEAMFAPLDNVPEDPATGSASAALGAYLVSLAPDADMNVRITIEQGVEMGRRSVITLDVVKSGGIVTDVVISGGCVSVMPPSAYFPSTAMKAPRPRNC